ncbi:MAG: activator of HSP90 ATPase [Oceanospirillaceae bacterium]|jgi:activator of HSP90 ATPase
MIQQEIVLKATVEKVYQTLTNSELFSEMTGAPASIGTTQGDQFSCFGGMILGRNIELLENKMLVQAWRVKLWELGHYSSVRFVLEAKGAETKLTLTHSGFCEEHKELLSQGWHDNYWTPMQHYFKH